MSAILAAFERDGLIAKTNGRAFIPSPPPSCRCRVSKTCWIWESPRAGRLRIHGLLEPQYGAGLPSAATVGRAMAIKRRVHGAPGPRSSAAMSPRPRPSPATCPIGPPIGLTSGL